MFLGVSKKVDTAIGMGAAVTFVLTIATLVTFLLSKGVLEPFNLGYLQTISFILVIAALVQMVEIILKKVSPALYQALGVFLPLITTNCAILGVAILVIQKDYNLLASIVYAVATSIGFALALIIFSGVREQLSLTKVPKAMEGVPIAPSPLFVPRIRDDQVGVHHVEDLCSSAGRMGAVEWNPDRPAPRHRENAGQGVQIRSALNCDDAVLPHPCLGETLRLSADAVGQFLVTDSGRGQILEVWKNDCGA